MIAEGGLRSWSKIFWLYDFYLIIWCCRIGPWLDRHPARGFWAVDRGIRALVLFYVRNERDDDSGGGGGHAHPQRRFAPVLAHFSIRPALAIHPRILRGGRRGRFRLVQRIRSQLNNNNNNNNKNIESGKKLLPECQKKKFLRIPIHTYVYIYGISQSQTAIFTIYNPFIDEFRH